MARKIILTADCEEVPDKGWLVVANFPGGSAIASGATWQEAWANIFELLERYVDLSGKGALEDN